jgi:cytidylate kinase
VGRKRFIVTIDGPSGAGKSSVAKLLARSLGYRYIDTGAMYRGVAVAYIRNGGHTPLDRLLDDLALTFEFDDGVRVFLHCEDISQQIRDPEVSLTASTLSQDGRVRNYLLLRQREIGKEGGVVLEGRDTGSVVFPDAEVKFYIDADLNERARRRHKEITAAQELDKVREDMAKRDKNDSERDLAPLTVPQGAIRVDTTGIGVEEVVAILKSHVEKAKEKWKS